MNYKVLVTDEATDDIFNLVKYIHIDLSNPDAAEKLYSNLNKVVNNTGIFPLKVSDSGIKYRDYIIHKKVFESYLLFYIIDNEKKEVYVLRILKDRMNWQRILKTNKIYHFTNYNR
ncbi:MAG: type II toxin-antitoxin system RelE/ParE family toxin [Lachnotalea sp.]